MKRSGPPREPRRNPKRNEDQPKPELDPEIRDYLLTNDLVISVVKRESDQPGDFRHVAAVKVLVSQLLGAPNRIKSLIIRSFECWHWSPGAASRVVARAYTVVVNRKFAILCGYWVDPKFKRLGLHTYHIPLRLFDFLYESEPPEEKLKYALTTDQRFIGASEGKIRRIGFGEMSTEVSEIIRGALGPNALSAVGRYFCFDLAGVRSLGLSAIEPLATKSMTVPIGERLGKVVFNFESFFLMQGKEEAIRKYLEGVWR